MKNTYAYYVVTLLLCITISLYGAATSSSSTSGNRMHIPLCIFIDQKSEEPDDAPDAPAMSFKRSLHSSNQIILASSRLVWYSFKNNSISDEFFAPKHTVYEIPMSSLFLFIPHELQYQAEQAFQLDSLTNVNDRFVLEELEVDPDIRDIWGPFYKATSALIDWLKDKTIQPACASTAEYCKEQSIVCPLKLLFKKEFSKEIIFDILLEGHGNTLKQIMAGLPISEVKQFLSFLQAHIPTNILWILTCQAGGKYLNELEYYQENIEPVTQTFNYTIIVSAVTDQTISAPSKESAYINNFFALAKELSDSAKGLNALLRHINSIEIGRYRSGIERFPLVLLPGIHGFHAFNINKDIFILNTVALTGHMLANKGSTATSIVSESTPFVINDAFAALIYPTVIKQPIIIPPHNLKDEWQDWVYSSSIRAVETSLKERSLNIASFPDLIKKCPTSYIFSDKRFPRFISMIRGNAIHLLSAVELLPLRSKPTPDSIAQAPQPGVLSFMQNAFFTDFGLRFSRKTFLINRLIGYNDLYALYTILKANMPGALFPPLADIAAQQFIVEKQNDSSFIARPVTLERVIAKSYSDKTAPYFAQGTLSFEFGDKAWEYVPNNSLIFREKDLIAHRAEFEEKAQIARKAAKKHIRKAGK